MSKVRKVKEWIDRNAAMIDAKTQMLLREELQKEMERNVRREGKIERRKGVR